MTLIVAFPLSRCLAPGKIVFNDEKMGHNNDVVACCNRHISLLTAHDIVFSTLGTVY